MAASDRAVDRVDGQHDGMITIHSLSNDARGVGRNPHNKTVFVRGALPDEQVTYRVLKSHSQFDEAEVADIIAPSADRVTAACEHFGHCGGCALQHLSPERQIDYKQTWLSDQLRKFANVQPKVWAEPLRGSAWGYRYKARLGVQWQPEKAQVQIGFRERKGRHLADITQCKVLHPAVGERLPELTQLVSQFSITHVCSQIEVAATDDQVALNFRVLESLSQADLDLLSSFGQYHDVVIYLQPAEAASTYLHYAPVGYEQLTYRADDTTQLCFQPYQFTQVNPTMNRAMIAQTIDWLQLSASDQVLDLFCGIGNFSLPIARKVAQVTGVEGDETAIASAQYNAERNGLSNTAFYVGNLFDDQSRAAWVRSSFTHVVLDPPRAGAREIIPLITQKIKPQKILYVSCDPATLARDIGELVKGGYKLRRAGVMDMFPHTAHVESMALLVRKT